MGPGTRTMTGTPRPCAAKMWFCSWSGLWEQQAGGKAVRRCGCALERGERTMVECSWSYQM